MQRCFYFLLTLLFFSSGNAIQGQSIKHELETEAYEAHAKARELGMAYVELDSIFYYISRSNQLFKELSIDSMIVISNIDLAYWYDIQGDSGKSKAIIEESVAIIKEGTHGFLKILLNLALANSFTKGSYFNIDSCFFYAKKAYINAASLDDCVHEMVALSIQIDACLKDVKYLDNVPVLFDKAKQLQDCNQETESLMLMVSIDNGRYLMLKKKFTQANIQFEKILSQIPDDDPKFKKYIIEFMGETYEAIGNYKVANEKHREVILLIQEIDEKEKVKAIQQVQEAFESEKKENQIIQLQATNELKEKIAKRQRILLWVIPIGLIVIIGLITQALRSSKKRVKSDEQLIAFQNEMSAMKSKLYTNITHEFRTPLTVIMGLTKKLKGNIEEKVLIERNSTQLLSMVNEMLDLSKADAGALKIHNIQSNIITYLEYLVESLLSVAQKKSIRLVFHSSAKEVVMDYDSEKIRQVCYNLLSNGLKFTPIGGKVILIAEVINNELVLKFSDSGEGVPSDELPNIFDRFYQASSDGGGGTGIGLALVKELVLLMNGNIDISSELDVGTEVTVRLPITNTSVIDNQEFIADASSISPNEFQPSLASQFSNNDKIALVVEDNEDVATYIERCIKGSYKVLMATNGEEGLIKALEVIPDIVISDVMMPIMNGYRLTKLLKSDDRTAHIPIILLTAKASHGEKLEGIEAGADAYLLKPFDEAELLIRMRRLIELRQEFHKRYNSKVTTGTKYKEDDFVLKVIDLLEAKVSNENYSVTELVSDLNLSRMQVHRKLKALTGMATTEFINHYKLERAHDLIQKESRTLAEVAYEIGFSSPSYFSLLFKEKYGYEPSKLRD